MKITLHTRMQDFGQMVDGITIELDQIAPALHPEDFRCTDCFYDIGASKPISGVKSVKAEGNALHLETDSFLYRTDFAVECVSPRLPVKIDKGSADKVELFHEKMFRPIMENGVRYRLYEPERTGPRPLILFCTAAAEAARTTCCS